MKVKETKIGGSIGQKVQISQFEPLDVNAYLEYTVEFEDGDDVDTRIAELEQKINETLRNQVNRRFEVGVRNYKEKIAELKKAIR